MLEAVVVIALMTVAITWVSVASGDARRRREVTAARRRESGFGAGLGGGIGAVWAAGETAPGEGPVPRDVHDDHVRRAGDEGFVDGLVVGHYVWPPREVRDDDDRTHDDRLLADGDEAWDLDDVTGDGLGGAFGVSFDGPSASPGDTGEDVPDAPVDDLDDVDGVAHGGWAEGFDDWDDTDDW